MEHLKPVLAAQADKTVQTNLSSYFISYKQGVKAAVVSTACQSHS